MHSNQKYIYPFQVLAFILNLSCSPEKTLRDVEPIFSSNHISAVNQESIPSGRDTLAIVHANIITGDESAVIGDGCLIIEGPIIKQVGRYSDISIPKSAKILEAEDYTVLPGLIDAHFHLGTLDSLPSIMLNRGITSLRDPGGRSDETIA